MNCVRKHTDGFESSQSSFAQQAKTTTIDSETQIIGTITSDNDIVMNGKLVGDILAVSVSIGKDATLQGNIAAQCVEILGQVAGNVETKTIHIGATASVTGNIQQSNISLAYGANIDGKIKKLP